MKTKLLTICLLLTTLLTSNVFSKNHQEIIGVLHITDNTGGIGVFDSATFKRLIMFQDKNLYKAIVIGYDWKDYNKYIIIRDDEGFEVDSYSSWFDIIRFIPTKYVENKISDIDSADNFIDKMKKEFCVIEDDSEECTLSNEYKFDLTTQNKIIDCIQKNKNEVLSKEQKESRIENYESPNIPKIWNCIYSNPSKTLFKKRD